jgi:hypothetical protein
MLLGDLHKKLGGGDILKTTIRYEVYIRIIMIIVLDY